MGLLEKLKFIVEYPGFGFKLFKLKRELAKKREQGKQLWVFQCDFKGHFPYLKPYYEKARNVDNVEIYFTIGYSKKDNPMKFLLEQGINSDHILDPVEYIRFTDWDVYMSPTEWGNVFPGNHECIRVQIFHTLADKKIEYSPELLKFNTIFANGPIHHQFLEKYIFGPYPEHRKRCKIINNGFAKIDDLFDDTYSTRFLKNQLNIFENDMRPIVLYAPNWEATSALYKYGERVFEYFQKLPYIFLIKLHYMSLLPREDHDATISDENHNGVKKEYVNWEKILNKYCTSENIHVIEGQSLNPWIFLSNVMLTDYGGAALEFICTGKPVVYLDCPEFFDMRGHDIFEKEARNTGYIIDDLEKLGDTFDKIFENDADPHFEIREAMRKELVYNPGRAAQAGFNAIFDMVESMNH